MSNYSDFIINERMDYRDSRSGDYTAIMDQFDGSKKLEQNVLCTIVAIVMLGKRERREREVRGR